MKFGISTFLHCDRPLTHQYLVDIAAAGFESIELDGTRSHADPGDRDASMRLKDWLADTRLTLHALDVPHSHAGCRSPRPTESDEFARSPVSNER